MTALLWGALGYLAGSFPTGYLAGLWVKGVDIRTIGSGGTGATNAGRLLGKNWAKAVAIADMLKGAVPMLSAMWWGITDPWIISLIAFAGVVGHDYPVWLSFKGGKGVSTSFGVAFFLYPYLSFFIAPAGGLVWLLVLKAKGYVSLASMTSLCCLPLFALVLSFPLPYVLVLCALALLAIFRHKDNIKRLREGKESRFGKHAKS